MEWRIAGYQWWKWRRGQGGTPEISDNEEEEDNEDVADISDENEEGGTPEISEEEPSENDDDEEAPKVRNMVKGHVVKQARGDDEKKFLSNPYFGNFGFSINGKTPNKAFL
jgi:hypothetical protein